jgi:hypothetical protein
MSSHIPSISPKNNKSGRVNHRKLPGTWIRDIAKHLDRRLSVGAAPALIMRARHNPEAGSQRVSLLFQLTFVQQASNGGWRGAGYSMNSMKLNTALIFRLWLLGVCQVVETTQGGVPAGESKIELILGDCAIQENGLSNGNPYSPQDLQHV